MTVKVSFGSDFVSPTIDTLNGTDVAPAGIVIVADFGALKSDVDAEPFVTENLTVTGVADGALREIVNFIVVVPVFPSFTLASLIDSVGKVDPDGGCDPAAVVAASSFSIVPFASPSKIVAPFGDDKLTVKVSFGSDIVSPTIDTLNGTDVVPTGIVIVADFGALKSDVDAEPFVTENLTVTGVADGALREIVNFIVVVPVFPSFTLASLIDMVGSEPDGAVSSFNMVPSPTPSRIVAPTGDDKLTVNVSSGSYSVSPIASTRIRVVVSPTGIVMS